MAAQPRPHTLEWGQGKEEAPGGPGFGCPGTKCGWGVRTCSSPWALTPHPKSHQRTGAATGPSALHVPHTRPPRVCPVWLSLCWTSPPGHSCSGQGSASLSVAPSSLGPAPGSPLPRGWGPPVVSTCSCPGRGPSANSPPHFTPGLAQQCQGVTHTFLRGSATEQPPRGPVQPPNPHQQRLQGWMSGHSPNPTGRGGAGPDPRWAQREELGAWRPQQPPPPGPEEQGDRALELTGPGWGASHELHRLTDCWPGCGRSTFRETRPLSLQHPPPQPLCPIRMLLQTGRQTPEVAGNPGSLGISCHRSVPQFPLRGWSVSKD